MAYTQIKQNNIQFKRMKSFRSELENNVIEKDILDLANKIQAFKDGQLDDDGFRNLRLARGVYGQRQAGVQMIRIKLPYGKMTTNQLLRICDVSQEYSTGNLHITTRQDIQIHYVSLDRTPQLWADLEKSQVTLREACGNTVRNVTGSHWAGINPNEPFDITPHAHAFFDFFLRNPICQNMGRKFKVSFSSDNKDDSLSYLHDLGFIPKIKNGKRGFKVMIAGGLGAQPHHAHLAYEFLEEDKIIPLAESILRVFDRHGERNRRNKARMKFFIKEIGFETFMDLVEAERLALSTHSFPIDYKDELPEIASVEKIPAVKIDDTEAFERWKRTNTFPQKQVGYFAIGLKITTGDIHIDTARKLADLVKNYAGDDMRLTIKQGLILRFVKEELLPFFYQELNQLGLAKAGFETTVDITTCPGTDTCNLGIASSMGLARELERMMEAEYADLIEEKDLEIKISGCMNACGQHNAANIGFQGMTLKKGKNIAPASQILLGGGNMGNGEGRFADKVLKIPSKRAPESLRIILNDFDQNAEEQENFVAYYDRKGKPYFFDMLKHLSDIETLVPSDFIDWGNDEDYVKAIGIGECASVIVDVISILLAEAKEAIINAEENIANESYADGIYHTYNSFLLSAKALLSSNGIKINTQASIITAFDEHYVEKGVISLGHSFTDIVYQINKKEPTLAFAKEYIVQAKDFVEKTIKQRELELNES